MSHKFYRNLAHLDSFPNDLNYTGIILDNWNHPSSLVPVVLFIFYVVFMGFPKSFTEWWVILCGTIIHPWMEGCVGLFGGGWKYMVDEYAVLDARYWALKDPTVMTIAATELFVMSPLCLLWYYAIKKNSWTQHYYAIVLGMIQLTGTIVYMGAEALEDYKHLPAHDSLLSPALDSYENLKYFWFIFIFLNSIWIVIPCWTFWVAYGELATAFNKFESLRSVKAKKNK